VTEENLASNKANECLKHLRNCDAAAAAGVVPPPPKRRAVESPSSTPAQTDDVCITLREERHRATELEASNGILASSEAKLIATNEDLKAKLHSLDIQMGALRLELEQMKQQNNARERERKLRDQQRDELLHACTSALGISTPPLPAVDTVTKRITGLQKAALVAGAMPPVQVQKMKTELERERSKRKVAEKNSKLVEVEWQKAIRSRDDKLLGLARRSILRQIVKKYHPDKQANFNSVEAQSTQLMQDLNQ